MYSGGILLSAVLSFRSIVREPLDALEGRDQCMTYAALGRNVQSLVFVNISGGSLARLLVRIIEMDFTFAHFATYAQTRRPPGRRRRVVFFRQE